MALNTNLMDTPEWLRMRSPWTQQDTLQALKLGIDTQQHNQEMALKLKQLELQREQTTILNDSRLTAIEDRRTELADMPIIDEYVRTGQLNGELKNPKSITRLSAAELLRARSDVGRQTLADEADFNKRLTNISAEDRAILRDMQRQNSPEGERWKFLDQATERQRALLRDTKYAPSEIQKLWDEANKADVDGDDGLATTLRDRARTLARGGREASIQNQKPIETMEAFKLRTLPKLMADPLNRKKTAEQLNAQVEALYKVAVPTTPSTPSAVQPQAPEKPKFIFEPGKGLVPVP